MARVLMAALATALATGLLAAPVVARAETHEQLVAASQACDDTDHQEASLAGCAVLIANGSTLSPDAVAYAHYNRGVVFQNRKQWAEAVAELDMAEPQMRSQAELYSMRGIDHHFLGHNAEARADVERGAALGSPTAIHNLQIELGREHLTACSDGAIDDCTWLIDHQPNRSDIDAVYYYRGAYRMKGGEVVSGMVDAGRSIAAKPSGRAYTLRGEGYRVQKQYQDALSDFQHAADLGDPQGKQKLASLQAFLAPKPQAQAPASSPVAAASSGSASGHGAQASNSGASPSERPALVRGFKDEDGQDCMSSSPTQEQVGNGERSYTRYVEVYKNRCQWGFTIKAQTIPSNAGVTAHWQTGYVKGAEKGGSVEGRVSCDDVGARACKGLTSVGWELGAY